MAKNAQLEAPEKDFTNQWVKSQWRYPSFTGNLWACHHCKWSLYYDRWVWELLTPSNLYILTYVELQLVCWEVLNSPLGGVEIHQISHEEPVYSVLDSF